MRQYVGVHASIAGVDTIFLVADSTIGVSNEERDEAKAFARALAVQKIAAANDQVRALVYDRPNGETSQAVLDAIAAGGGVDIAIYRRVK